MGGGKRTGRPYLVSYGRKVCFDLTPAMLRRIDEVAERLRVHRSEAIRRMVQACLDSGVMDG